MVNIAPKCAFHSLKICIVAVRCELNPISKAASQIVHKGDCITYDEESLSLGEYGEILMWDAVQSELLQRVFAALLAISFRRFALIDLERAAPPSLPNS